MRLRNFHLFKLPIDNTYENVFDGWLIGNELNNSLSLVLYDEYLINTFGTHTTGEIFSMSYNRSVKISNGISTITLPMKYEEVKDYNYIIINTSDYSSPYPYGDMQFSAYFITSVSSENDSEVNPSCTITIEYDVWANNYWALKTKEYNDNGFITEGHIHRFEETEIAQQYTFKTIPNCEPRCQPQFTDKVNPATQKIVWAVYEWNVDYLRCRVGLVVPEGDTSFPTINLGNLPRYGQFVYTFRPWALVQDNGFITANFEVKVFSPYDKLYYELNPANLRLFEERYSNRLNGIYLTYNPPFSYTGSIEDGFTVNSNNGTFAQINNPNTSETLPFDSIGNFVISLSKMQYEQYYSLYSNRTINDINAISGKESEIPYLNYPYAYTYFDVQGKQFVINDGISFPNCSVKVTPFVYGAMYTVQTSNKNIDNVKHEVFQLQSLGSIPITTSNLVEHFANNSFSTFARLLTGEASNALDYTIQANNQKMERKDLQMTDRRRYLLTNLNTFRKFGKTLTLQGAVLNGISQVAIAGAQLADYARQNYNVKNDSNFSELMMYSLDRLIIRDVQYIDNELMDMDYRLTQANGYIFSRYASVIDNSRVLFDYVKALEFNPTIITNTAERNDLIELVERGIRKWHLPNFNHPFYSAEQKVLIKTLDTRVPNPEPFLID